MNLVYDLSLSNVVSWLLFGLLVGTIAHLLDRREVHGGILATIITGIAGAVIGGFFSNAFFGLAVNGFNLQSVAIAVAGSLLLVLIQRALFSAGGHIKTNTAQLQ